MSLVSYGPSSTVSIAFLLALLLPGACEFHAFWEEWNQLGRLWTNSYLVGRVLYIVLLFVFRSHRECQEPWREDVEGSWV